MALNKKIVKKVQEETLHDDFLRTNLTDLLVQIEAGHQPKREIDKIVNKIKVS